MRRLILVLITAMLILMLIPTTVLAEIVFIEDSYTDKTKIDIPLTTAEVDTDNGWVVLGRKSRSNAVVLYEDSYDITIVNGTSIETYSHDGSSMVKNNPLSISGLQDPVSISTTESGQYLVLDKGDNTATYYMSTGSAMVANPILSASGFTNPIAISTQKDSYDFSVLDGREVNWHSFDGSGMILNTALSIELGEEINPISLSSKANSYDYAIVDSNENQILYYSFDGSSIALNPLMSITAPGELTKPKSIGINPENNSYAIVDDNTVKTYNFDGTQMVYNSALSVSGLNKPVSVVIKPGSYDYAVIDYDGSGHAQVRYFAFTGTGMEEITDLRITGLSDIPYASDQMLMGKAINAGEQVRGLKLTATVDIPVNTSITWEVTVDGLIWKPIIPGGAAVRFSTPNSHPNYRAVLHTTDLSITPKILDVKLIDNSLIIIGGSDKSGYRAGEAMILHADTEGAADAVEALMWWAGGNGFTIETVSDLVPDSPVTDDINYWYTRHDYPSDYDNVVIIPQDMPDGEYTIQFTAYSDSNEAVDTITIEVAGSQFNKIITEIKEQRYLPYD